MKRKIQNREISEFYIVLVIILLVILVITLRKQQQIIEQSSLSPKYIWKRVVKSYQLESDLNLKFVRSSELFTRKIYEYLYNRKNKPEEIAGNIREFLENKGIPIGDITISETGGDIRIRLLSEEKLFAEIICTPDMSTFAGNICIIIDDFGYNFNVVTKEFLKIDAPITFAVIPGHNYSKKFAEAADNLGYEVMIHMPMDSKDHRVGEEEYLISSNISWKEISNRTRMALLEIPQAKGINNHQGSDATESKRVMKAMAQVLRAEGKYFVDSRTTTKSMGIDEMERAGVPVAERTVFIDYEDSADIVQKQIALLSKKARNNGAAIGIGHPRRNTLEVLLDEIPRLKSEGFNFVFASKVVK